MTDPHDSHLDLVELAYIDIPVLSMDLFLPCNYLCKRVWFVLNQPPRSKLARYERNVIISEQV